MLQKKEHAQPRGGDDVPRGWEKITTVRPSLDEDQYSSGSSSVVTLRSPSVMIQSFKVGVTW